MYVNEYEAMKGPVETECEGGRDCQLRSEFSTTYFSLLYTCFVMASVSDRKVIEMRRLKAQLTEVATELPKLLAHIG